jgi:4-aminobutyrate aminotransferase
MHQSLSTPCLNVINSCEGIGFTDMDGKVYLDFHGNNVHPIGFSHPEVVQAIIDQMQKLSFCTRRYTNEPAVALAKKLSILAPGDLNKVLFAPAGTLAIGMAVKLARAVTGRHKTISMWDSFHGASLDSISLGGEAIFRNNAGPLLTGTCHVPPPDPWHCLWDCKGSCRLKCAEYVMEKEGDIAAVISETVRSTPYIPPKDYWSIIRSACNRYGALLILDEIPHAFGRTGKMFTVEHYDIVPDMLVVGKSLGGGIFPLAALIAREGMDVMKEHALGHYTHEKNPVGCAAALAMLQVLESEKLPARADKMGVYAQQKLLAMKEKFEVVGDVRGIGLLLGVELVKNRTTMERAGEEAEKVMYHALSKGLNFKLSMGNIITLTPALTITREIQSDTM